MKTIDLNSDLGEGFGAWSLGDDSAMLDIVTSANIACGFHAGGPAVMVDTCRAAIDRGVMIGAHVSYPDLVGFGRRAMDVDADDLYADVLYQLGALNAVATAAQSAVRYVKPHGALYNAIVHDRSQAEAVVRAVWDFDRDLAILGLPDSAVLLEAQRIGLRCVVESFADRAYQPNGSLVNRREPGAVLTDQAMIAGRVLGMVQTSGVAAVDGSTVKIIAQSVCVHGDTPGAVGMARAIRIALEGAGVAIASFSATPGS